MADLGYVRSALAGLSNEKDRRILQQVFDHVLGNIRYGPPEHQERATNFQSYFLESTTASTANEEFSIRHGLATTPRFAMQILELGSTTSRMVRLQVARAADSQRVYLNSPETSERVFLLVED